MEEKNLLEIQDLVIRFHTDDGVIEAVNGISLSLKAGETLGLVGETGAGTGHYGPCRLSARTH